MPAGLAKVKDLYAEDNAVGRRKMNRKEEEARDVFPKQNVRNEEKEQKEENAANHASVATVVVQIIPPIAKTIAFQEETKKEANVVREGDRKEALTSLNRIVT